ncbi:putative effector protein [Blumeria hordei DH14]|uniref:Putative effector protein n=1 Tax=Blumeria graminis f. sp. hordei (strain DH14) TaxID=546991 RepID=N1JEI5_BLUG1|nr:putative effector protein [Blumeria hordei DH14]
MYCINAVLLIQNVLPNIATHMIFTGIDREISGELKSQVGVYKSSTNEFPKPEDNSGIFMAVDSSQKVGYHHAIYCSKRMQYQLMMSKIMGTIQPLSKQALFESYKKFSTYESCFQYLRLLKEQNGVRNEIYLSKVIDSRRCTPASISILVYQRRVTVTGDYNSFAPTYEKTYTPIPIEVKADIAVKVEDLVLPRHSIIFSNKMITRALVWYQGEMQVIQQCGKDQPAWYLITNLTEKPSKNLAWALRQYNEIAGKNEMLLGKSELPIKSNLKKLSRTNSDLEDPHYKIVKLVRRSRSTQRVNGVLVKKSQCHNYQKKSLRSSLRNRLFPLKGDSVD